MALLRNPKKAPTKVKGTDTQNHKANKATKVKKGMAAEDPSYHKTRFITKNRAKTTLKTKIVYNYGINCFYSVSYSRHSVIGQVR